MVQISYELRDIAECKADFVTHMVGVFQIIAGFGLFARRSWAWWVAIIVTAVALIHPIVGVLSGNFWGLFGLIIPGLIFYYLMKQDIKAVFTH